MEGPVASRCVHISWALVRVAKAFLETPRYDPYDLSRAVSVRRDVIDNLIVRMVVEGWLTTEDGWLFEVTTDGRRALVDVLTRARAFSEKRQGAAS
jgi:predicted transcriptional regulator